MNADIQKFISNGSKWAVFQALRFHQVPITQNPQLFDELKSSAKSAIVAHCMEHGWDDRKRALAKGARAANKSFRHEMLKGFSYDGWYIPSGEIVPIINEKDKIFEDLVELATDRDHERKLERARTLSKQIVANGKRRQIKSLPPTHPKAPRFNALAKAMVSICMGDSAEVACADAGIALGYQPKQEGPTLSALKRMLRRNGVLS